MINVNSDYIYFNPGDVVMIKHPIDNKPKMLVLEKVTKTLISKDSGEKNNIFCGIKCMWFDKNQELHNAIFSTKDLIHVE